MPSMVPLKLTDLPLVVLARCAAMVSQGSPCTAANLPFQVTCGVRGFAKLNAMRACCRLLREAANLSIGGVFVYCNDGDPIVNTLKMPEETKHYRRLMGSFTLNALLSLPCLRDFTASGMVLPEAVATFLESATGLKRVELRGRAAARVWRLSKLPSSDTIEQLELSNTQMYVVARLLSFPFKKLKSLEFCGISNRQAIPKKVLRMLKSFRTEFYDITETKGMHLKKLTKATKLESLELAGYGLKDLVELRTRDRFETVSSLKVELDEAICDEVGIETREWSKSLAGVFEQGCLPHLQKLEIVIDTRSIGSTFLQDLEPALTQCGRNLKELFIKTPFYLTERSVSMLKTLQSFCTFDLRYEMNRPIDFEYEDDEEIGRCPCCSPPFSVKPIASLQCLTTLRFSHRNLCDIQELTNLPKLKELSFSDCRLPLADVLEMNEKDGPLENIRFENCEMRVADEVVLRRNKRRRIS